MDDQVRQPVTVTVSPAPPPRAIVRWSLAGARESAATAKAALRTPPPSPEPGESPVADALAFLRKHRVALGAGAAGVGLLLGRRRMTRIAVPLLIAMKSTGLLDRALKAALASALAGMSSRRKP